MPVSIWQGPSYCQVLLSKNTKQHFIKEYELHEHEHMILINAQAFVSSDLSHFAHALAFSQSLPAELKTVENTDAFLVFSYLKFARNGKVYNFEMLSGVFSPRMMPWCWRKLTLCSSWERTSSVLDSARGWASPTFARLPLPIPIMETLRNGERDFPCQGTRQVSIQVRIETFVVLFFFLRKFSVSLNVKSCKYPSGVDILISRYGWSWVCSSRYQQFFFR